MAHTDDDHVPAELRPIAELLREQRATASAHELDALKLRVARQAGRPGSSPRPKGQFMKSRFALTAMIVAGLLASGTGTTLAISGSSGSGNAAQQQYNTVQPEENSGGNEPTVLGDQGTDTSTPPVSDTQQVEAVSASSDSLPFTGFFTIPLIVAGLALLSTGVFLRKKSSDQS